MDLRRLGAGEWIAALGGTALLVSLFLAWYDGASGWEAFTVTDIFLAVVAVSAIALVPVTASQRVPAIPLALDALVAIAGKLALVVTLIRIAWGPDGTSGVEAGAWLALAGGVAIVVGGWTAMRDERLSAHGRVTDLTGRPNPESPAIESLPAP